MASILHEFLRSPQQIGAIVQSSRFLVRRMVDAIDVNTTTHIVELGAGTGIITKKILDSMNANCKLTVIESNESFAKSLWSLNNPQLSVFHTNAEQLSRFVSRADAVISGIPLGALSDASVEKILYEVSRINGLKQFIQFQYTRRRETVLKKYFDVSRTFVPLNIPPAYVYVCTPKKQSIE